MVSPSKLLLFAGLVTIANAQLTHVVGPIMHPDGTPVNGQVVIRVPKSSAINICSSPAQVVALKSLTVPVVNGVFDATLYATPCLYLGALNPKNPARNYPPYDVTIWENNRVLYRSTWAVPNTGTTSVVSLVTPFSLPGGGTISGGGAAGGGGGTTGGGTGGSTGGGTGGGGTGGGTFPPVVPPPPTGSGTGGNCPGASGSLLTTSSCSFAAVQNAVNSAASGDTVLVPGGTCNWGGSTVTIPNTKGITLDGSGSTTITGSSHILIQSNSTTPSRVTRFTFTGSWPTSYAIAASGSSSSAPYRIDHNTITGDPGGNTSYSYRVQASDTLGQLSLFSNTANAVITTATANVALNWEPSTSTVGLADYIVQRCQGVSCTNFAQIASFAATSTTYNDAVTGSSPAVGQTLIQIDGNGTGLIDTNTLSAPLDSAIIHNLGTGDGDTSGWGTSEVTPGSSQFVYVEHNTISNSSGAGAFDGCSAIRSNYGARTVARSNTIFFCQIDQQGTATKVGARWWEIYNNIFQVPSSGNQSNYMDIRAGSGVIFNNHMSGGPNLGAGSVTLREEDSGYPALYQIGRGYDAGDGDCFSPAGSCGGNGQHYSPVYIWGNDAALAVGSGSSNVVQDRDFFLSDTQPGTMIRAELSTDISSTTYSYTPFAYPYPLNTNCMPTP